MLTRAIIALLNMQRVLGDCLKVDGPFYGSNMQLVRTRNDYAPHDHEQTYKINGDNLKVETTWTGYGGTQLSFDSEGSNYRRYEVTFNKYDLKRHYVMPDGETYCVFDTEYTDWDVVSVTAWT
jgi:hypothetical protein